MHPETIQLRQMLQSIYDRHTGYVGFIDESYRASRINEFPFYTVTATVIHVEDLDEYRSDYCHLVGDGRWHTTEANKNGQQSKIREFINLIADHKSELVVSVQVEILEGDLEHARRECLIQTVSRLTAMKCDLIVYERREDRRTRNADEALFARAKRDGFIPRNTKVFAGSPSAENLLWGPDLAGWAMRRYVALNETEWVAPILDCYEVIDASPGMTLKEKGPKPAAAMGPGPESSVGPEGEGRIRSSSKSMTRIGGAEKTIFEIFSNVTQPIHDPAGLSDWLHTQFQDRE
ncbi:MAG: hypothetical protein RL036_547 [Actinomycetota bacterium]|jgi:hypothetical protein